MSKRMECSNRSCWWRLVGLVNADVHVFARCMWWETEHLAFLLELVQKYQARVRLNMKSRKVQK